MSCLLAVQNVFNRVPACQVTTYYYVGFAYMIMRRYADAIKTFSNILLYIQRTRNMFQVKNYQNDLVRRVISFIGKKCHYTRSL